MKRVSVLVLGAAVAACATQDPRPGDGAAGPMPSCRPVSEADVAALFERWNRSLQSGDAREVVANYAERSILLPTLSDTPRLTPAEKEDYFRHFLAKRPFGTINLRFVELGCNAVVDAGLYTFTFGETDAVVQARYSYTWRWDGATWLITTHHSSAMPGSE